jgi:hypothetical protein
MILMKPIATACLALSLGLMVPGARAQTDVDLQLVVAVDASFSVDAREYALQLDGIAAAFRDPEVQDAIAAGRHGRIAVALAVWAESRYPKSAVDWYVVDGPASAEAFSRSVETYGRPVEGGTRIGRAVMFCISLIESNGFTGGRRVIDVSGDGPETALREWTVTPQQAGAAAAIRGITVNGLAILSDEPKLDRYYARNVIDGPGAFVMAAHSIADFAAAMRLKLIREIKGQRLVSSLTSQRQN